MLPAGRPAVNEPFGDFGILFMLDKSKPSTEPNSVTSESSSDGAADGPRVPPRPPRMFVLCWASSIVLGGAYGGWQGDAFVGFHSALACAAAGVILSSGYQLLAWCRNPGRYEDGRLHFRSLLALVVSLGILGGLLLGVVLWLTGLVVSVAVARIAAAGIPMLLPPGWADETMRTLMGAVGGILIAAITAWGMLYRRKR